MIAKRATPFLEPSPPLSPSRLPPFFVDIVAEGVLTCQKDVKLAKHNELDLPNLHVIKAMLSMKSRGHVREVFNWQWHYFFLTDSGIEYLKAYLNLPEDVVPATLKSKAGAAPAGQSEAPRRKEGDAPASFRPSFGAAQ